MKPRHMEIYAIVSSQAVDATRFVFVALHPQLKPKVPHPFGYLNDSLNGTFVVLNMLPTDTKHQFVYL